MNKKSSASTVSSMAIIDSAKLDKLCAEAQQSFRVSNSTLFEIADNFYEEMKLGLTCEVSSLLMLPAYISSEQIHESNLNQDNVLVIDIGGSTLRLLIINIENGQANIIHGPKAVLHDKQNLHKLAGFKLFLYTAAHTRDFLKELGLLNKRGIQLNAGLVFSFRYKQTGKRRGEIISLGKGFNDPEMIGRDPVSVMEEAFAQAGILNVHFDALINDSTGVLLAGAFLRTNVYAGTIMGTETNLTVDIPTSSIQKPIFAYESDRMIIITESSYFEDNGKEKIFTRFDKEIAEVSTPIDTTVTYRLGRIFGGFWIGNLLRVIIKETLDPSVMDDPDCVINQPRNLLATLVSEILALSEKQLNCNTLNGLLDKYHLNAVLTSDEDAGKIMELCRLIITRSARIAAAIMTGAIRFVDPNMAHKHLIPVDGSIYVGIPDFRETVESTLGELGATNISVFEMNDGPSIGAAIAVALNQEESHE